MKQIQLEYFMRVVEEKSFTKAAEKLFISQPALSKAIQSLEKELNVALFSREGKELSLTENGKFVYQYAEDVLSYWNTRTSKLMSRLKQSRETLRFGLPPSVGNVFFSKILYQFKRENPQVDLQLFEGTSKEIEKMIANGQIDLGIVVEPYENPLMELKTIYRSEVVLAVHPEHRLAGRKTVDFRELKNEPMLIVSEDYMFHDQIVARCRLAGFKPNIVFTAFQWDLLLEMAAEKQGVTFIGRPIAEKLYGDRLACISLENPQFPWTLGIIGKKTAVHSGAIKQFWDFSTRMEEE